MAREKASYIKITAIRRGGKQLVERHVKITSKAMTAVDVHNNTIRKIKTFDITPCDYHPSDKRTFDRAKDKVMKNIGL